VKSSKKETQLKTPPLLKEERCHDKKKVKGRAEGGRA